MTRLPKTSARAGPRPNPLLSVPPDRHPSSVAPASHASARLWLCLYLPSLPLEAQATPAGQGVPAAACAEEGRHILVVAASPEAAARGVQPGMPVNAALALLPALLIIPRRPELEAAALTRLARWAARFTPTVVIHPDGALLLEVRGSLRLFDGLPALRTTLNGQLRALGHEARMAWAPTSRAALWLARADLPSPEHRPDGWPAGALRQALATIPVARLGWPVRTVRTLLQMGVTTVGDCLRLPREGFTRRLGAGRRRELDEALGHSPESWQPHVAPARFQACLELPADTADATLLLDGFRQLLFQLRQALVSRQAAVRRLWCRLVHPDGDETRLCLVLRQPVGAPAAQLAGLLRLRLEALVLPAPVVSLALQSDLEPAEPVHGRDLLGDDLQPEQSLGSLLDRLRARLGREAVQGLALRAEHRPELAWRPVPEPGATGAGGEPSLVLRSRPLWLLPAPRRLGLVAGQPGWRGPLRLDGGPERIESGWWDGGDVRRDYYRASNARGDVLWVYQDLRNRGWYLHGVFG
jgi:protein ImuB